MKYKIFITPTQIKNTISCHALAKRYFIDENKLYPWKVYVNLAKQKRKISNKEHNKSLKTKNRKNYE